MGIPIYVSALEKKIQISIEFYITMRKFDNHEVQTLVIVKA